MRPSRRLSVALAAAATALLTACTGGTGSTGGDAPQAAPSPSAPSADAVLRRAALVTELAGRARYSLTTSTTLNGQEVAFSGEGVYDWNARTGRTTYKIPVGAVEQRLLRDDLFFVLPQQPGIFFRVPTQAVAASPLGGSVHPTTQLNTVAAVEQAERVDEVVVRGVPTTHYRGTYDVRAAVERAQGAQRDALRSALGAAVKGVASAPYDVYVDAEGRVRRLEQSVEVPASPQTGGQPLTVRTTLELYDFGLPVKVPGPPGDKIRDGGPLLAALRKALPEPPPAAEAPPLESSPLPASPVPLPSAPAG